MATHHLKDLSSTQGETGTQERGGTFHNSMSFLSAWGLIFLAWALIFLAGVTGQDHLLHYEVLFEPNASPLLIKLIVFLLAWQVMIVAMMLPTSLPLIRLFTNVSSEAGSVLVLPVFLAAYLAIWTGSALLAFFGDLGWHLLLSYLPWRLMIVIFAVGSSHLTWMLVLTGVMAVEKTVRWGRILVPVVGVGLIVWGTITLLHPIFTQT